MGEAVVYIFAIIGMAWRLITACIALDRMTR